MFENAPFTKATTILYTLTSFSQLYISRSSFSSNFLIRVLLLFNTQQVEQILGTQRLTTIACITAAASSILTRSPFVAVSATLILLYNSLVPSTDKYLLGGILPIDNKTIVNLISAHILLTSGSGIIWKSAVSIAVTLGYFAIAKSIPRLKEFRVPRFLFSGLEFINTSGYTSSDRVHDNETEIRFDLFAYSIDNDRCDKSKRRWRLRSARRILLL
jgi:hypothetical protein